MPKNKPSAYMKKGGGKQPKPSTKRKPPRRATARKK